MTNDISNYIEFNVLIIYNSVHYTNIYSSVSNLYLPIDIEFDIFPK